MPWYVIHCNWAFPEARGLPTEINVILDLSLARDEERGVVYVLLFCVVKLLPFPQIYWEMMVSDFGICHKKWHMSEDSRLPLANGESWTKAVTLQKQAYLSACCMLVREGTGSLLLQKNSFAQATNLFPSRNSGKQGAKHTTTERCKYKIGSRSLTCALVTCFLLVNFLGRIGVFRSF